MREFKRAERTYSGLALAVKVASGSSGLLPKLTLRPVHNKTLVIFNVQTQRVPLNSTLCFLGTSGDRAFG